MAVNPVTVSDLQDRWRPLTAEEVPAAVAVLEDAWAVLVAEMPTLPARLDEGTVDVALVRSTVARAALRDLRNPDGVTMRQRTLANYTEQDQFERRPGVFYTADDLRPLALALSAATQIPARGAFTIRPGVPL